MSNNDREVTSCYLSTKLVDKYILLKHPLYKVKL